MTWRSLKLFILVASLTFTARFAILAQTGGATRIRTLDALASQASSSSDPSELIQTLLKTSYSPLFSEIPANDPLVAELISLQKASGSGQQTQILDSNIARAYDAWRTDVGLRNFIPTTAIDVHSYRQFLSHFAPNLISKTPAAGQVSWQLTPAEAVYVLDLMMGSGGIAPTINAYQGGNQSGDNSGTFGKSPGSTEYWQDVERFYSSATAAQRSAETSSLFLRLGIVPQSNPAATSADN